MLDLKVLRDLWTEPGARHVFELLVTQCVRSTYPTATTVRAAPGDEGIDTIYGTFGKSLHVWQSKYFPDGIGEDQKKQIRSSFKRCMEGPSGEDVDKWTLCVPCALSMPERRWWQGWKRRNEKKHDIQIEMWAHDAFVAFHSKPDLARVFQRAMRRGEDPLAPDVAMDMARSMVLAEERRSSLVRLPSNDQYSEAVFVRKLEAAGVRTHLAKRAAFYNYEIQRASIDARGDECEIQALDDLLVRTHALWEEEFIRAGDEALGRQFVVHVDSRIREEDTRRLATELPFQVLHKQGALYACADDCTAGWTADHHLLAEDASRPGGAQ